MSVKLHEPYCLDSQMGQLLWFDDFLGDQVQDEWHIVNVGGGTTTVVDGVTGGIMRLSSPTNGTGDRTDVSWNTIRSLLASKKLTFEIRFRTNSANLNTFYISLSSTAGTQYIDLRHEGGGANYLISTRDAGGGNSFDSGVAVDTDWHILRIECRTDGGNHVHYYMDNVETANSPVTTDIPFDATDFIQPYFLILTGDTNLKTLEIDYVAIRQEI